MPLLRHSFLATPNRGLFATILSCALFMLPVQSQAQNSLPTPSDSVGTSGCAQTDGNDSVKTEKISFFKKIGNYFRNANKPKPDKKFDISFIGGPQYSSATQFGIGIMAAGLYRSDRSDLSIQPSNVSLFGNVSTSGFYMLGVRGTHILPEDRYRLLYTVYFYSMPSKYWGIGYKAGSNNDYYWSYLRLQSQIKVDFLFRLSDNLFIGPMASFDFVRGTDFAKKNEADPRTLEQLIDGETPKVLTTGAGASIVYDSRDVITDAHKGIYLKIEQGFYPGFLGNKYDFMMTDFIFDLYQKVWKGGVLALDLHGRFNYGDVPWTMKSRLGGMFRMRGYYEGQYRDNNLMEAQLELRQRVWKRNGVALWVGAGNVFENFRSFDFSHTLPNFGIGYRWEFKSRVNVRLDLGFGKNFKPGFMFNINEAF